MRVSYNMDTGVVDIGGLGQISDANAINLAVQLVFITKGYITKTIENGVITEFNFNHPFFIEYAKLMGIRLKS